MQTYEKQCHRNAHSAVDVFHCFTVGGKGVNPLTTPLFALKKEVSFLKNLAALIEKAIRQSFLAELFFFFTAPVI